MISGDYAFSAIWGADGPLSDEVREGRLGQRELDTFVNCGFLRNDGKDSYTVQSQQIIEAVNNDFEDPINVPLEDTQRDLLITLVEIARRLPSNERKGFFAAKLSHDPNVVITHEALTEGGQYTSLFDLQPLIDARLVTRIDSRGGFNFDISPLDYQLYAQIKRQMGQPVERVAQTVRNYLDANEFRQRYPLAYSKWIDAESRQWGTDPDTQQTTIGSLCREAMQEFAAVLVDRHKPPAAPTDKARTKDQISAVINHKRSGMSERANDY